MLISFCVSALSLLGLLMVLSASSVTSIESNGTSYGIFLKQVMFFAIGVALLLYGTYLRADFWEKFARLALPAGAGLLLLPIAIGKSINGNKSWIGIGSLTIQPSEFAKMALILWCALQLRRHHEIMDSGRFNNPLVILIGGAGLFIALIMAGKDLGTAGIVAGIAFAMIYLSGLDLKVISGVVGLGFAGLAVLAITAPNRLRRFKAVINPFDPAVYKFAGWQPAHSQMALASGGFFGVGLGASKQKWANLSEAHTDFIFSIIGEELGLVGTIAVVVLYAVLLFAIFRTAINTRDLFAKYAVTGIGCWLIIQVVVNLCTDVGLFPVIGVTLPFISYGGSSLIANFIAIGFVLNVCRRDPAVRDSTRLRLRKSTS
jgi:cell division protein FtsW